MSESEKRQIEIDARIDSEDGIDRKYRGDALVDAVFAPVDFLAGTQSTSEHASEKQSHYDDVKDSIDRRR